MTPYQRAYRMPDGRTTTDAMKYSRAWRRIGRKLEKMFPGYTLNAFDPNLHFAAWGPKNEHGYNPVYDTFTISLRAAKVLLGEDRP
jgi:hypothetical protein